MARTALNFKQLDEVNPSFRLMNDYGLSIKAETSFCMIHEAFASTLSSNNTRLCWIYFPKEIVVNEILFVLRVAGVYAESSVTNNLSLYSVDMSTKIATLRASTGSQTASMFAGTPGIQRFSVTTPYTAPAGWYLLGMRYHNSSQTTAPTVGANTLDGSLGSSFDGMRIAMTTTSSLPATIDITTATANSQNPWMGVN